MSELVGVWFMIMLGAIGMVVVAACFWAIIVLGFSIKDIIEENAKRAEGSENERN